MPTARSFCICALLAIGALPRPIASQVVKLSESELTPYRSAPEIQVGATPMPHAYIYASVRPGTPGAITGANAAAVNETALGFTYPSLDFVFSAASKVITDGVNANTADSVTKALSEVTRINSHVRVEPSDDGALPTIGKKGPAIMALALAPEAIAFAATPTERDSDIATGVAFAERFMGPVGALVSGFQATHKASRAPSEIAYQSSDDEFGWTWYESSDAPIEGLHRCAALLEAPANVKNLHVTIDIITEWRHYGSWKKSFDFQVPVLPPLKK